MVMTEGITLRRTLYAVKKKDVSEMIVLKEAIIHNVVKLLASRINLHERILLKSLLVKAGFFNGVLDLSKLSKAEKRQMLKLIDARKEDKLLGQAGIFVPLAARLDAFPHEALTFYKHPAQMSDAEVAAIEPSFLFTDLAARINPQQIPLLTPDCIPVLLTGTTGSAIPQITEQQVAQITPEQMRDVRRSFFRTAEIAPQFIPHFRPDTLAAFAIYGGELRLQLTDSQLQRLTPNQFVALYEKDPNIIAHLICDGASETTISSLLRPEILWVIPPFDPKELRGGGFQLSDRPDLFVKAFLALKSDVDKNRFLAMLWGCDKGQFLATVRLHERPTP